MNPVIEIDSDFYTFVRHQIMSIVAECLGTSFEMIQSSGDLSGFNLDSLTITRITNRINESYGLHLSPTMLFGHRHLDAFIDFLFQCHGAEITASGAEAPMLPDGEGFSGAPGTRQAVSDDPLPMEPANVPTDGGGALTSAGSAKAPGHSIQRGPFLIVLSAHNARSLAIYARNLLVFLEDLTAADACENETQLLSDLEHLLLFERLTMPERLVIMVHSLTELWEKLAGYSEETRLGDGVFGCRTEKDDLQVDLFLNDDTGRQLVRDWFRNGKLDKIGLLWLKGVRVDWAGLFPPRAGQVYGELQDAMAAVFYSEIYPERIPSLLADLPVGYSSSIETFNVNQGFSALETLSARLCFLILGQLNLLPLQECNLAELKARVGIGDKFDRLLNALVHIGESCPHLSPPVPDSDEAWLTLDALEAEKEQFLAEYSFFEPHVALLWKCVANTLDILQEKVSAVEVIFPKMSMELVEPVYKNNPLADHFNILTGDFLSGYVEQRVACFKEGERLTVLEVGAGTGGTSSLLFDILVPHGDFIEYVYTDVSPGFVQYGKHTHGERLPHMAFKLLNVEMDTDEQDFDRDSVDVIIGANVIHATSLISNSLLNLKKLLKRNGVMVLNEVVGFQNFSTLTFGLLDGWWLYQDEAERIPHSPLLTFSQWEKLFQQVGFPNVCSLNDGHSNAFLKFQDIIVAESDGHIP